ncbi:hypothetical protein Plec18167_006543 [Paecilomyces lecythidis]|uniref:nitrilase n=1 Tax=Paecilomyces lecythidis TaxID=3004212 RepID=A0ABR3XB89_9EURO
MTGKTVRVAVTQTEPAWLNLAAGVKKTCALIEEAAKNGAELIAFPECWIPGYPCWIWARLIDFDINVKYVKNSLNINSPEMETIRTCACDNQISVVLGFSENDNNSLYISQAIIGPDGNIKCNRRKMKPTHMERTIFGDASGEVFNSVASLPFGRVGALSCWEHIQPLLKFHTFSEHEDIHVSAWPSVTPHTGGPDLWSMSAEGCQNLSRTYAIESQTFVLHSTALITEKGIKAMNTESGLLMSSPGGGSSTIFGPDGRRLSEPVESTTETIIYADLDLEEIIRVKMFADGLGHYSRPDLMWLGTCKDKKKMVLSAESASTVKEEVPSAAK